MQSLFNALAGFIGRLRLWCIIDEYAEAGLFRCGRYRKTLGPGWHWLLPILDDIEPVYIRPRVLDVGKLSLPSVDGKVMAVSGNVEYEIVDTRKALLAVYDRRNSLEGAARGIISQVVMKTDFSNGTNYEMLAEEVRRRLADKAADWGVAVRQFWFTELVTHRVIRLLQDEAQREDPTNELP